MIDKQIIETIRSSKKITLDALCQKLHVNFDDISLTLKELCEENESIKWSINNVFYFVDNTSSFFGSLKVTDKGYGFVMNTEESIDDAFVSPVSLNNAITGDAVVYKLAKEPDGRFKAEVVDIIERAKQYLVGEIVVGGRNGEFLDFAPSDPGFGNYRIKMVNKKDFNLKKGQIVRVRILRADDRKLFVKVTRVIGDSASAADRILSIAYEFGIEPAFHPNAEKEADRVATAIDYNDEEVARRKKIITDLNLVTIDGVDSKDLDDAVYIKKNANGTFRLLVAIADVSYYVRPRSELDNNAMYRGNSVYLVNSVIPMLPKILSDGVCSLNPNEEKLCMVCDMTFDVTGKMTNRDIYESIMISKARLNYKQVNEFYATGVINESQATQVVLQDALELHNLIESNKDEKGVIDFDIREPKIILDGDSKVIDIVTRDRGVSERLIENFMVAANEAVATAVFEKELPFVYRNHDKPNGEDIVSWMSNLKLLGINATLNTDLDNVKPRDIRKVLEQISTSIDDETEKEILNITLLHHMAKAKYEAENIGHFGLASKCYTHFTSPIRRYSDLMVHRYLKQYLIERDTRDFRLQSNEKFIAKACGIINDTEKQAVDAEREVNKVCMTEYMTHHIDEEYVGIVAAVLKFGLFIQINNCIEGLVHISMLPDYTYDEKTSTLVDKQNKFYRIGQKVKIKVINADVKKRIIDFDIIK